MGNNFTSFNIYSQQNFSTIDDGDSLSIKHENVPMKLRTKLPLLKAYGWRLVRFNHSDLNNLSLCPPGNYECKSWCTHYNKITVDEYNVCIPDYIYEKGVIETGTRTF